jgi:hypothetical protein
VYATERQSKPGHCFTRGKKQSRKLKLNPMPNNKSQTTPEGPLEGYRPLNSREIIQAGDLFTRNGKEWLPVKKGGGPWDEKTCWPMIRKIESHTAEPWKSKLVNKVHYICSEDERPIAIASEEDAKRIVTCVNGSTGIQTPETTIPKMVDLLRRAATSLQEYCADTNGDMNDSLATEIENLLESKTRPNLNAQPNQG